MGRRERRREEEEKGKKEGRERGLGGREEESRGRRRGRRRGEGRGEGGREEEKGGRVSEEGPVRMWESVGGHDVGKSPNTVTSLQEVLHTNSQE